MIEVSDKALRHAATEGMDAFLNVIADACRAELGGELTAESMGRLNGPQHTLLAYLTLRDELMDGGFCQLVQNGYGPYIFHNPVARVLKQWGLVQLAKLLYDARDIYEANRADLERERTDEEFMAMYEQYEAFDELEDDFVEHEEEWTEDVARYVDGHLGDFAKVIDD